MMKITNYFDISSYLDNKEIKRNDRFIQYGIVAAKMAVKTLVFQIYQMKKIKYWRYRWIRHGGLEAFIMDL